MVDSFFEKIFLTDTKKQIFYYFFLVAGVAELADASDSKPVHGENQ